MGKAKVKRCPVCGAPLRSATGAWSHAYRHFEEAARQGILTMERINGAWVIKVDDRTIVGAGWLALLELAPLLKERWKGKGASSTN